MPPSDLDAFRRSITAPLSFETVSDLIPRRRQQQCIIGDAVDLRTPLRCDVLHAFIQNELDLQQFGLSRESVVCTSLPNGPEAAVCFWAISSQCVFAPLNPALTAAELDFELHDLPCALTIVLEGGPKHANQLVEQCCAEAGVPVLHLVPSHATTGLFSLVAAQPSPDRVVAEAAPTSPRRPPGEPSPPGEPLPPPPPPLPDAATRSPALQQQALVELVAMHLIELWATALRGAPEVERTLRAAFEL